MLDKSVDQSQHSGVSRRQFLEASGAVGVAIALAGCGSDDSENAINIASDQEYAENEEEIVDALYEAGLDEDIEVNLNATGDEESGSRRSQFVSILDAGRTDPDIFRMDSGWTIPFIVRDQLVNLSEELSSDTLEYINNDYQQSLVQTTTHPETGDLYGLPLFPDYPVMHYRKDLVEEAGYDPEGENWATEPMTWQRFSEIAADVWDQSDVEYGFTTQADEYVGLACCTFSETMTSMGGAYFGDHENLFGPVGDRPITVNEEPVHDTIRMMRSFMFGPDAENAHPDFPRLTNSDLIEFTEESSREPFTRGEAVFMRNWPYVIPINFEEGEFDESDYGVMPLPYGVEDGEGDHEGTGGSSHALGGWHLTINPNSENIDESIQVLEAFANENVMLTIFEAVGNLPPVPDVIDSAASEDVGPISNFLNTFSFAAQNTVARPVTEVWTDEAPVIADEVNSAYRNEKSPEQAMTDLESRLRDLEESEN